MIEYIIYTKIPTEDGKEITMYASDDIDYAAIFFKKENRGIERKITKFQTINSAIIWWNLFRPWFFSGQGNLLDQCKNPSIRIGKIINDNLSDIKEVHKLTLEDSIENVPDLKIATKEELKEYFDIIDVQELVTQANRSITENARKANAEYEARGKK